MDEDKRQGAPGPETKEGAKEKLNPKKPKHTPRSMPGAARPKKRKLPPREEIPAAQKPAVKTPPAKGRQGEEPAGQPKPAQQAGVKATGALPLRKGAGKQGTTEIEPPIPSQEQGKDGPPRAGNQVQGKTGAAGAFARQKQGGKTIKMPLTKGKRRSRNKKRLRRLRAGVLLAVVLALVLFVVSGLYLRAAVVVSEAVESARIGLTPGGSFPMEFAITGYKDAQPMGSGFAVLGDKDMAIVSANGLELRRVQHGYVRPVVSAGNNRLILYNRGTKEYLIEGRSKNLLRGTTEQDIIFAQMSRNGRFALCTGYRNSQKLEVYGPTLEWEWTYTFKNPGEIPLMAAFSTNNSNLAVGVLQAQDGALGSNIYLLRAASSVEKAQMGVIQVPGAIPLHMQYTSAGRLLVVFDTGYAALYNNRGEEMARYDYDGRAPISVSSDYGNTALIFGSDAQDAAALAILDKNLEPLAEAPVSGTASPRVMAVNGGALVFAGQQITAVNNEGALVDTYIPEARAYGLVKSKNKPVLLVAGSAEEIDWLMLPPEQRPAPAGQSGASAKSQSSMPLQSAS